jgi:thymidylate synthase (FAD)
LKREIALYKYKEVEMEIRPVEFKVAPFDGDQCLENIERYGRVCYQSEQGEITAASARDFVSRRIKDGHESILEHEKITVIVRCDRGVTHEIVRHRIGSYSQESTRYCNYGKMGLRFIRPLFFADNDPRYTIWLEAMNDAELAYNRLLSAGASPEEARSVLPNSLATQIVITYNLRQWRHFFHLRTSKRAHPQMREVALGLLRLFKEKISVVFDDIPDG